MDALGDRSRCGADRRGRRLCSLRRRNKRLERPEEGVRVDERDRASSGLIELRAHDADVLELRYRALHTRAPAAATADERAQVQGPPRRFQQDREHPRPRL